MTSLDKLQSEYDNQLPNEKDICLRCDEMETENGKDFCEFCEEILDEMKAVKFKWRN